MYKATYALLGVTFAGVVPAGAGWLTYHYTTSMGLGVVVAAAAIYHLMAMAVGILSLSQYVPESLPLGPSFMSGHGLLSLGMTVGPALMLPGLVWLFVLPFDEQGYLDLGAWFQLDMDSVAEPHHEGA